MIRITQIFINQGLVVRKQDIDYLFESACLRKANLTEEVANRIIDTALQERKQLLYYYKCPYCSSIHLTKQEPYEVEKLKVI